MAQLELVDVAHSYVPGEDENRWALKPLTVTFEAGKTYALVGPSGCGKTTLLNIFSGLVPPSRGRVLFDGVDMTRKSTRERNIAQVFQFPVVYTSMTVYQNLAFPLECRNWDGRRIDAKVRTVAEALDLSHRLKDQARKLNADDKQLISLGRGLVRDDVAALLMDEPLTVIDPQLKFSLRRKIREISEQFRPTVIYVTHDQYEAMSFVEELLVMKDGRVMQQGTPEELFESPRSAYVGYFIGSPSMNFLDVTQDASGVWLDGQRLAMSWEPALSGAPSPSGSGASGSGASGSGASGGGGLQAGIRPEYVRLAPASGPNTFAAQLRTVRDHGPLRVVHVEIGGQPLALKLPREAGVPRGDTLLVELPRAKVLPYVDGQLATLDPL